MTGGIYEFVLSENVPWFEAEMSLHLAVLVAEGLYGEAAVQMDVRRDQCESKREFHIDGSTEAGLGVVRVFTTFLNREYGSGSFVVRRVESHAFNTEVSHAEAL